MRIRVPFLIVSLLAAFISLNVQADTTTTVVEKRVIVTPAPKATCTAVPGRWEGNVWIEAHDVCKYENRAEGAAWVNDYWSCTDAKDDGTCTTWTLVPGHWVKTLE